MSQRMTSEPRQHGLWLDEELQLHCADTRTGERLLRPDESRQAQRDAESRAQSAEEELARLRAQLK